MSAFSTFLANKVIDHMLRNQAYTTPAAVYVALFTAADGLEANTPTAEVLTSGTGYTRKAVTLAAAANGATENNADVLFNAASANWGTITHAAIMDAATAGNVLMWKELSAAKTIEATDVFVITAGNLDITLQ
ncbi:MAG: hypothetical protein FD170_3391 [Bacteroidetes bacterium]|nr:MAG: hypothetical protein FD170_3391 [Bacteroidota bacterium]